MVPRWKAGFIVALVLAATPAWPQYAEPPTAPTPPALKTKTESEACLDCHKDDELEIDLESEEVLKLYVDKEVLAQSVHAKLACTECHSDLVGKTKSHKGKGFPTAREYLVWHSEQCKQCHFSSYTRTLDSVHQEVAPKDRLEAVICTDCHGGHDMSPAAEPRSKISRTCARCHEKVSETYAMSVHGKSLAAEENPDVPTCTDCHRSHDILSARSASWRLDMPQMCGSCHTHEKMMKKYGLSTQVLSTYLADFHGATAALQHSERDAQPVVALCTDCHGVHDIRKADDPDSQVVQANLVKTCQKCHEDADESFPAAWLSHYEPSWEKAPLVYAVTVFYDFLIPFMIGGLALQILLHLWRVVVNR